MREENGNRRMREKEKHDEREKGNKSRERVKDYSISESSSA